MRPPSVYYYDDYTYLESARPTVSQSGEESALFTGIRELIRRALRISAVKSLQLGPHHNVSWTLRVYPSSGALYPTEVYFFANRQVLHYDVRGEGHLRRAPDLEKRVMARSQGKQALQGPPGSIGVALTSIWQRQSFKYGERGLRYAFLDAGHALAALEFGAQSMMASDFLPPRSDVRTQGVHVRNQPAVDLQYAFPATEEFLYFCTLEMGQSAVEWSPSSHFREEIHAFEDGEVGDGAVFDYYGTTFHQYGSIIRVLNDVLRARGGETACANRTNDTTRNNHDRRLPVPGSVTPFHGARHGLVSPIIKPYYEEMALNFERIVSERRTATSFARELADSTPLRVEYFDFLMDQLQVPDASSRSLLVFVHRVQGVGSGLYLLPQRGALQLMGGGDMQSLAHNCACGQDIAANGYFSAAVFGNLSTNYRDEHVEAGRLGHRLYLSVEHLRTHYGVAIRASGIGCFVDALFEEIGIHEPVLYMLAAGWPITMNA
eukprot:GEMP01033700.1.p1 GENE.GEMP01033700.1~~GEMP01033700.1.p1  ORF type:complete len:491 (+),score=102.52 GEMP01033700.1:479-1951(+)